MLSRTFTLGRYTCVERIGTGPLGEHWRAKRFGLTGVERHYLGLKLHSQLAGDAPGAARLQAAAKAYSELDAEGLLRLVEQGHQGADHYAIYEFVGHADLRRLKAGLDLLGASERKSMLPALVVGVGQALAATLAVAHKKGVVHGLLAPQSVWIDAQGAVRVADVGFFRLLPKSAWSGDERLKPWQPYLAPEQVAGGDPTPQSDVYALGALLGELLGRSQGEASDVEKALRAIIEQAQRKAPAERFPDAEAMHRALLGITLPLSADVVRETLARVGQQFLMVGDAVPQPVVISERSSAEPLPPPPSLRTGKISIAVGKNARSRKDGLSLPGDEAAKAASQTSGPRREEDTPLPNARPLLMTNPKIATRGPAEEEAAGAAAPVRGQRTSGPQGTVKSGIDWLTGPEQADLAQLEPDDGPSERQVVGTRPQTRRGVGPVSVNPRAQHSPPKASGAASATTPTQDLDVATAAATLAAEQGRQTPIDVGVYAPLVGDSGSRNPYDSLSHGETNPSLAPVRRSPSQPSRAVGDEPTSEVSLTDIAAAEAELLSGPEPATGSDPAPHVASEPAPSSVSGYPDAMSPSGDVLTRGVEPARGRSRTPLLIGGLALVGIAAVVAIKFLTGGPAKPNAVLDGGAADGGRAAEQDPAAKAIAAGELEVTTTPAAYAYVDRQPRGKTPATLRLGTGSHKLLLVVDGYKLKRQDVSAGAPLKLALEPAVLPADVAGTQSVKVKCKTKSELLRIYVDRNDTGLPCPTDDLKVSPGKHTFGFLNPVTEVMTEKSVKVKGGKKDTKLKVKVP